MRANSRTVQTRSRRVNKENERHPMNFLLAPSDGTGLIRLDVARLYRQSDPLGVLETATVSVQPLRGRLSFQSRTTREGIPRDRTVCTGDCHASAAHAKAVWHTENVRK